MARLVPELLVSDIVRSIAFYTEPLHHLTNAGVKGKLRSLFQPSP